MVRLSKLAVGAAVVLGCGGLLAAYTGNAEPYVSPSALPGPPVGIGAGVALVLAGFVAAVLLDRRAWLRAGRRAGLSTDGPDFPVEPPERGAGSGSVGTPALTGTVDGRLVRARTYSTGGGSDSSSTTYTVVEAAVDPPVDWTATLVPPTAAPPGAAAGAGTAGTTDDGLGEWRSVDGGAVWGGVPDDVASDVLSGRARDALATLGDGVTVGDVKQRVLGEFQDALAGADDSVAASLAEGVLGLAGGNEKPGPSRAVRHRAEGTHVDAAELRTRAEAVAAVAEAVERAAARAR